MRNVYVILVKVAFFAGSLLLNQIVKGQAESPLNVKSSNKNDPMIQLSNLSGSATAAGIPNFHTGILRVGNLSMRPPIFNYNPDPLGWGSYTSDPGIIGFSTHTKWLSYNNMATGDFIVPSGKFGIGTENPMATIGLGSTVTDHKLHLYEDDGNRYYGFGIRSGKLMMYTPNDGATILGTLTGNEFTEYFRVHPGGNIGIGNSAPAAKLSFGANVNDHVLHLYEGYGINYGFGVRGDQLMMYAGAVGATTIGSYNNNTFSEYFRVHNNGNIGIGNTAPSSKLEIGQDGGTVANMLKVHGSASFNNDKDTTNPTQVSINTNANITGAALSVGGPTYIGSWKDIETNIKADYMKKYYLWVKQGVVSEDFAVVSVNTWKDEVFKEGYKLPALAELEEYIRENKHLPGIPSEKEVKEKGYTVNQMTTALLEKVEHLMLYSIEQNKEIDALKKQLKQYDELAKELSELKDAIRKIK